MLIIKLNDGRRISKEDFDKSVAAGELSIADVDFTPDTKPAEPAAPAAPANLSANADNKAASKTAIQFLQLARQQYGDDACSIAEFGAWPAEVANGEKTLEAILSTIKERTEKATPQTQKVSNGGTTTLAADGIDKFATQVKASLVCRSGANLSQVKEGDKLREAGAGLMGHRLSDIARQFLHLHGIGTAGLSNIEITKKAMSYNRTQNLSVHGMHQFAFNHTTGSLPALMLDAANKALGLGFQNAPSTYQAWVRTVSISDFKPRNVVMLSEGPRGELVPEGGPYPYKTFTDAKESYSLKKTGSRFGITMEAIYNDDLDGLTRVPFRIGATCRTERNAEVYGILNTGTTSAQNMRDGNPLFDNSNHANNTVDATTGALNTAGLSAARSKMRQQTGPNGNKLNIAPRFILVPTDLETAALQFINSETDAGQANPSTINTFRSTLIPIVDAELTVSAAKPYFLAADPSQADTIEMGLLNGVEEPLIEEFNSDEIWGMTLRATNVYQAKAIDWRGLHRSSLS
jgi:hypothetical protein